MKRFTKFVTDWNRRFDDALVAIDTKYSGRIDWDTAAYMRNQGYLPEAAARRYVEIYPEVQ